MLMVRTPYERPRPSLRCHRGDAVVAERRELQSRTVFVRLPLEGKLSPQATDEVVAERNGTGTPPLRFPTAVG